MPRGSQEERLNPPGCNFRIFDDSHMAIFLLFRFFLYAFSRWAADFVARPSWAMK
ncbi:MAG: hypothetical protein GX364_08085 [Firmicutes bacterium]|nr:hypothetical protein [Bacillota bacterium]